MFLLAGVIFFFLKKQTKTKKQAKSKNLLSLEM